MEFHNPPDAKEILTTLNNCENSEQAEEVISTTFPNWITMSFSKYSQDYPHLQNNWEFLCGKIGVSTQKIIIVKDITFDDNHTLLMQFCEYMTKHGYCVRREGEFFPCSVCGTALPCKEIYDNFKARKINIPETFQTKCLNC